MPERAVYHQIAERLRLRIRAGEFAPGQRLPSEADLAHEYGFSHTTIGAAIAVLRSEGLLEPAVPGRAAIVREPRTPRDVVFRENVRVTGRVATAEDVARHPDAGIEPGESVFVVAVADGELIYPQTDNAINFHVPE